jgi:hypothetical protein
MPASAAGAPDLLSVLEEEERGFSDSGS